VSGAIAVRVVNRLIDGLPHSARAAILKRCKPVDLAFGSTLCEPDRRLQHVYFPLTGIISLVTPVTGHPPLEMGLIGNEGMLGATVVLGISVARLHATVHRTGTALRLSVPQLRQELAGNNPLRRMMSRYLYVLLVQLSQTAACARFHEVEARLARWLLLTHDRAHSDHFRLTHQYLAGMLGVQRSAVTIAAGALQRKKLIRYVRGKIEILDRPRLEAASCSCYGSAIRDYSRVLS
jgi:CRP-like cAMP-binding protein